MDALVTFVLKALVTAASLGLIAGAFVGVARD